MKTIPFSMIAVRPFRAGDLIGIEPNDGVNVLWEGAAAAIVVKASGWHAIRSNSIGGDVPKECQRYYQILTVLKHGRKYPNIHSHTCRLLSSSDEEKK